MIKSVIKIQNEYYYQCYFINKKIPTALTNNIQNAYIFKSKKDAKYFMNNIVKNYYKDCEVIEYYE